MQWPKHFTQSATVLTRSQETPEREIPFFGFFDLYLFAASLTPAGPAAFPCKLAGIQFDDWASNPPRRPQLDWCYIFNWRFSRAQWFFQGSMHMIYWGVIPLFLWPISLNRRNRTSKIFHNLSILNLLLSSTIREALSPCKWNKEISTKKTTESSQTYFISYYALNYDEDSKSRINHMESYLGLIFALLCGRISLAFC